MHEFSEELEKQFKSFAVKACNDQFFKWLQFKGNTIFWSTICCELVLISPVLLTVVGKLFVNK